MILVWTIWIHSLPGKLDAPHELTQESRSYVRSFLCCWTSVKYSIFVLVTVSSTRLRFVVDSPKNIAAIARRDSQVPESSFVSLKIVRYVGDILVYVLLA